MQRLARTVEAKKRTQADDARKGCRRPAKYAQGFDHHAAAAQRFADMLLGMRAQGNGSEAFWKQMQRIFKIGPTACEKRCAEDGVLSNLPDLRSIADWSFFLFDTLADHVVDIVEAARNSLDASEYAALSEALDKEVLSATANSRPETESAREWMTRMLYCMKWNGGRKGTSRMLSAGELFVHIPLVMYVQNTLHLYIMLGRLNSDIARGAPNAEGGEGRCIKHVLDSGGQPYSYLVFAVVAALQMLYRVRAKLALDSQGIYPLTLLASNPRPLRNDEKVTPPCGNGFLFRGLWVPSEIDENRARFQYSFTSWSRTLEGVLWVLDFYAHCLPVAQNEDWHILLLISKSWQDNPWATPVQLFGGPSVGPAEKEVMLPPFMVFDFDEDLELRSDMQKQELQRRGDRIVEKWGLADWKAMCAQDSEDSLASIRAISRKLPDLLTRSRTVFRKATMESTRPVQAKRGYKVIYPQREGPRVTVRFVSHMEPQPPIREMFENEDQLLFAFPP